ncbi:hypothetical protein CEXT_404921 [Caerostris extrusa]|uniref:Uncharacterized protein n=1 Tax=Caerostris extrusa TaxID=172846 RepID=A0AAV4NSZ7_CAEEX|nr:hypothetical protein CEXT_404921 [Caerostris extrusa]
MRHDAGTITHHHKLLIQSAFALKARRSHIKRRKYPRPIRNLCESNPPDSAVWGKNEEACVGNPHHKSCALDPEMRRSGRNTQWWEDEEVSYCYSIYLVIIVWS